MQINAHQALIRPTQLGVGVIHGNQVHDDRGAIAARLAGKNQSTIHRAMKAGRLSYLAGRMPRRMGADPSSPLTGLIR